MERHRGPLLADANVIIECDRLGVWRALTGGYQVETVAECVREAVTGEGLSITPRQLRDSLVAVHEVGEYEIAELRTRIVDVALDPSEEHLWAHALARSDSDWKFCGPDLASMRCGVRLGFRWNIVSLEELLRDAGHSIKGCRGNYTKKWSDDKLNMLVISEVRDDG